MDFIVSDEGFGSNPYIETTRPLVVITAPGPCSGKLATCLSQLYHEYRRGVKAGYASVLIAFSTALRKTFLICSSYRDTPSGFGRRAYLYTAGSFVMAKATTSLVLPLMARAIMTSSMFRVVR